MDYQALYRKYRPQRFSEIIGQDHVAGTLAREVVGGTVAHAYLFAGPRGTGKTTTARILAKALNCPDRAGDGEPCNVCPSCVAITEGSSLDVIELDAASHNKVEDIREIRFNVGTVASVDGARRIYILDEAHMLSRAASNALLKTLEEPPEHVHFVLATTEPYKLLDTVRSRSQRFDFHPVGVESLAAYLKDIAARERYEVNPDGLQAVAQHAQGSVRDGLSLLEQVAALGRGKVEAAGVARALGLVEQDAFQRLAEAVADQDARAGLELVAEAAARGADLRRFIGDALAFFRGVFLTHYAPNVEEITDEPADRVEVWRRLATVISSADVLRVIEQLSDALIQLREGREERLVVELAVIRLTRPETAIDPVTLAGRIERLEERLRRASLTTPPAGPLPEAPPPARPAPAAAVQPETTAADVAEAPTSGGDREAAADRTSPLTLGQVETVWPALIGRVREQAGARRFAYLREASPASVDGDTLVLDLPAHLKFHLEALRQDDDLRRLVESVAADLLGGTIRVDYQEAAAAPNEEPADDHRAPDKHQLVEAGEGGIDPTDLLVDMLDGEVVEEN